LLHFLCLELKVDRRALNPLQCIVVRSKDLLYIVEGMLVLLLLCHGSSDWEPQCVGLGTLVALQHGWVDTLLDFDELSVELFNLVVDAYSLSEHLLSQRCLVEGEMSSLRVVESLGEARIRLVLGQDVV